MSLWIEVRVGSRESNKLVAASKAWNVSDLADVSDYEFNSEEFGAPHLNIPPSKVTGSVKEHSRNQSVWSLVKKIAEKSIESNK